MRSKLVIDKIKLDEDKTRQQSDTEESGKNEGGFGNIDKSCQFSETKRVEETMDLGQGDYQLPGTDRMLTDVAMVPPILMAEIKSTGYKSKRMTAL